MTNNTSYAAALEAALKAATDVILATRMGDMDSDLRCVSSNIASAIRALPVPQEPAGEVEPEALRDWRDDQLDRVRDGSFLTRPTPPAVRVKPLEWSPAIGGGWIALGAAGNYFIHAGESGFYFTNPFDHEPNEYASPDAAKAAAQADYERRIMSAIEVGHE